MRKIIASRHPAAVAFIRGTVDGFSDAEVLPSATAEEVKGADVVGNLPLRLAALCGRYRAVELPNLDRDLNLRGVELTPEQMRELGATVDEYYVRKVTQKEGE